MDIMHKFRYFGKPFMVASLGLGLTLCPSLTYGELVDPDDNAVTNATYLGDIDMSKGTMADLGKYITDHFTAASTNDLARDIKEWTTNTTVIGYTDWTFSGDTSPTANYTINMTEGAETGTYNFALNDTVSASTIGTITTNLLNPTHLEYPYDAGTKTIVASRNPIRRNTNGFAYYTDVQDLHTTMSQDITNAVERIEENIEAMDTSYFRYNYITNKNQSVQYWAPDATVTNINIQIPDSGMTKDWVVYIFPATNVTITLPSLSSTSEANYWMTSPTVTNAIPAGKPTALYFSQVNENTFSMGRKEFGDPVTIWTEGQRTAINTVLAQQSRSKRRISSAALASRRPATANKPTIPAKPAATNTATISTTTGKKQ